MEKIGLKQKDVKIISYSDTAFNDPFSKMRISKTPLIFMEKLYLQMQMNSFRMIMTY